MRDLYTDELDAVFGGARVADTSIMPQPGRPPAALTCLTPRQAQCLAWVAAGKTSAEIGAILGLSPLTIDTYLKAACRTLGVASRAIAARATHGRAQPPAATMPPPQENQGPHERIE